MKLIECLMRSSKRTNELIKNWQMGFHSAVLGILPFVVHPVCLCMRVFCKGPENVWFHKSVYETGSEKPDGLNEFRHPVSTDVSTGTYYQGLLF